MPFVTKLTLESGDRHGLDDVVDEIKSEAARKGVEFKGPHPDPPEELAVPQATRLVADGDHFSSWRYTVYRRSIEIVGYDDFARSIAERDFPDGVYVSAEIEQRSQT
jgi:ribosomal protein S10